MSHLLSYTSHRPWPLPRGRWVMRQTWAHLLFAHWPVSVQALRARVPAALEIDTYHGQAWLGVVPFAMRDVVPRGTFAVPGVSDFLELNVRTYVRLGGKPGVYFFSLEADQPLAVEIARRWYQLPYMNARMRLREEAGGWIDYHSVRTRRGEAPAEFKGRYRPTGPVSLSRRGSLEEWLSERYCLYTLDSAGRVCRGEIQHALWPLQPAEAQLEVNTMAHAAGLELASAPHLLYVHKIETLEWPIRVVQEVD